MFTGIVQQISEVLSLEDLDGLRKIRIAANNQLTEDLKVGASVSINGTCLTAVKINEDSISFDAIAETLKLTNLGELVVGSFVNVERSVSVGDEIGGHVVSGHIDGTAVVESVTTTDNNWITTLSVDPSWMKYIQQKGFIAVDGSSLTVVDPDPSGEFSVHLIPETLKQTVLSDRKVGDRVNIEIDQNTKTIVNTVERTLRGQS